MGIFDTIIKATASLEKETTPDNTAKSVGKGKNTSQKFVFEVLPKTADELKQLKEASLDSAFKTTALTILALCRYEDSPEDSIEMLEFLKGPAEVSGYEKQFIHERLSGKGYKAYSFFEGAMPENGYTPTTPYTITVSENPYSFDEENWATLYVTSGGADSPRPIKLRKKPSVGQWFLNDIQCLSDIRIPTEADPWA